MVFAVLLGLHTFLPGGSGSQSNKNNNSNNSNKYNLIIVITIIIVIIIVVIMIYIIQNRYEPVKAVSRIAESCKQLAVDT